MRAKRFCDTPPPPGDNKCSTLSRQIDHAKEVVQMYIKTGTTSGNQVVTQTRLTTGSGAWKISRENIKTAAATNAHELKNVRHDCPKVLDSP